MNDLNIALTESASLRSAQISRYGDSEALTALQKAKGIVMAVWQGTNIATTEQIAEYYEVPADTVQTLIKRHREELEVDGLKRLTGKDLKGVVFNLNIRQNSVPSLTIWTPRAALRAGMLLRDSLVAKEVRNVILDLVETVSSPQLTEIQILAQIVNSMALNEQRQIQQEQQIVEQNRRIAELEQTRDAAIAELTALPISSNLPPDLNLRAKINMLVRNYCDRHQSPHHVIWNYLYKEMYYRYRYSVQSRCKKSGIKKLDQIESDGRMQDLFDLASLTLISESRSLQP